TVDRHFRWMEEYDLDGVMLQRFSVGVTTSSGQSALDQVARNVRAGAEAHGRVFSMMYDTTGQPSFEQTVERDWMHLVDDLRILESPRYLHHRGQPLLAIWNFGSDPAQAQRVIRWFKSEAPPQYRVALMGGIERDWRGDTTWAPIFETLD